MTGLEIVGLILISMLAIMLIMLVFFMLKNTFEEERIKAYRALVGECVETVFEKECQMYTKIVDEATDKMKRAIKEIDEA